MGSSPRPPIFKPPAGLQPHERVVWAGQDHSRIPARGLALIALLFGGLPFLYGLINGTLTPATFTLARIWDTWQMWSILILLSTLPFVMVSRRALKTRYYLTTFRLVKSEHGKLVQEISKATFKGKTVGQYLQKSIGSKRRLRRGKIIVTLRDPNTGGEMMNLGRMQPSSVRLLESYIGEVHCQRCGVQNDRSSATCSSCGTNL